MKSVNVICVTLTKALTKEEGPNVFCDAHFFCCRQLTQILKTTC